MLIVKIMCDDGLPELDPSKTYMLFDDVRSITFYKKGKLSFARMYILDNVKSALVPGFVEHEVNAEVQNMAYIMNDRGRTIDKYCAYSD